MDFRTLSTFLIGLSLTAPLASQETPQVGGGMQTGLKFFPSDLDPVLGAIRPAGDYDGDGLPDLLIGGGPPDLSNSLMLCGSSDGAILWTNDLTTPGVLLGDGFGSSITGMSDNNSDGLPEYAAGAPFTTYISSNECGAVYVLDGATQARLQRLIGSAAGDHFGFDIAADRDLNGDGIADLLVGAPGADPSGLQEAGSVHLYDGSTFTLLLQVDGPIQGGLFGSAVSYTEDADGDGLPDILVGAPSSNAPGSPISGSAYLHSGADGSLLQTLHAGHLLDRFGTLVTNGGDLDGDGLGDALIGAPGNHGTLFDAGAVYAFSGADGSLLHEFTKGQAYAGTGSSLAGGLDFDGDGFDDIAFGSPDWNMSTHPDHHGWGAVEVRSGLDGSLLAIEYGLVPEDRYQAPDYPRFGRYLTFLEDISGDGLPELVSSRARHHYDPWQTRPIRMQYASFGYSGFLASDAAQVSDAFGGLVTFEIDFPDQKAARGDRLFQLMASTATGLFQTRDINIPLQPGTGVLNAMLNGSASGFFLDPIAGVLDDEGDATVRMDLPAGAASGLIGTSLYFVAAETVAGGVWPKHASMPVELEILP